MPLAKRIVPCLDVDHGRVVKGINFLELKHAGDPVEMAKRYSDEGADELVFLDITASNEKRDIMRHTSKAWLKPSAYRSLSAEAYAMCRMHVTFSAAEPTKSQ
jgi:hypothetical protein